jgi:hypothetical protein
VDPMFMVDLKNCRCLTFKMNIAKLAKRSLSKSKTILTLLNRTNNKPFFLRYLKEQMLNQTLSLIEISQIFKKINSIYK